MQQTWARTRVHLSFFSFLQTLLGVGTLFTPCPGFSISLAFSSSWLHTSITPLTFSSRSTSPQDSSCTTIRWPTLAPTNRVAERVSGFQCSLFSSATSMDQYRTSTAGPSPSRLWWGGWLDSEQNPCCTLCYVQFQSFCCVKLPTQPVISLSTNWSPPESTWAWWDTQSHIFFCPAPQTTVNVDPLAGSASYL